MLSLLSSALNMTLPAFAAQRGLHAHARTRSIFAADARTQQQTRRPPQLLPIDGTDTDGRMDGHLTAVVKVVMCSRGGSASEVETHKNIDSVLHTETTFQAHSIFSVSIQK